MSPMTAYLISHPEFSAVILWPLVTAFLTVLFKPRTPEAYESLAKKEPAWFFSRFAASWQLLGALGLDPIKATEAAKKVLSGKVEKK
jgi:hypothetical protein